jgi:hypothetical protein
MQNFQTNCYSPTSLAMSLACPRATPAGWCSMTQVLGSTARFPLV